MPILHVEASFISVERGLRQEILSQTSLKCYIHFSFILKLIIFIYKQLKRPVAFSAVHKCTRAVSAKAKAASMEPCVSPQVLQWRWPVAKQCC